jgi:hypothetical protein
MNKYILHVSMPSTKFGIVVEADSFTVQKDRLNFITETITEVLGDDDVYVESTLVASYPSQYTIIEKIERNEKNDN